MKPSGKIKIDESTSLAQRDADNEFFITCGMTKE
jgi:hypothetical protein